MSNWCQTCGQDFNGTGYECQVCSEARDVFEKALGEGRVRFSVPHQPKVGDVIDIQISPPKEKKK